MNAEKINEVRKRLRTERPLIHAITNPISMNLCANVVLGLGARVVMAEHPREVAKITKTANALLLNLGNISDSRMEAMKISGAVSKANGIPVALDIVGCGCSALRRQFAKELIRDACPMIIKGNYSEIKALYDDEYSSIGIDSEFVDESEMIRICKELAIRHNAVILASGKRDVVTDGKRVALVKNGCSQMASVTGTGCMLGAVCTTLLSVADAFDAGVTACAVCGICGETAQTQKGSGSFLNNLLDNISTLTDETVGKYLRLERMNYEEV